MAQQQSILSCIILLATCQPKHTICKPVSMASSTTTRTAVFLLHDLFMAELPRNFPSFSDNSRSRSGGGFDKEFLGTQSLAWTMARIHEILTNDRLKLAHCRAKAICQTAKYLRHLLSDSIRVRYLMRLPQDVGDVLLEEDDEVLKGDQELVILNGKSNVLSVWRRSLADSKEVPNRGACAIVFPCRVKQLDVNYVPMDQLVTVRSEKAPPLPQTAPPDAALRWILAQVERIAFSHSSILSENCRVQTIARIATHVHFNSTLCCGDTLPAIRQHWTPISNTSSILDCIHHTRVYSRSLTLKRLGLNKFSQAWLHSIADEWDILEHEYPCHQPPSDGSNLEEWNAMSREADSVIDHITRWDQFRKNTFSTSSSKQESIVGKKFFMHLSK